MCGKENHLKGLSVYSSLPPGQVEPAQQMACPPRLAPVTTKETRVVPAGPGLLPRGGFSFLAARPSQNTPPSAPGDSQAGAAGLAGLGGCAGGDSRHETQFVASSCRTAAMGHGTGTVSNLFPRVCTTPGSADVLYLGSGVPCLSLLILLGDGKLHEGPQGPCVFYPCCVPQCLEP